MDSFYLESRARKIGRSEFPVSTFVIYSTKPDDKIWEKREKERERERLPLESRPCKLFSVPGCKVRAAPF